jgi:uncharacterized repeat protein (TIGR03803 family)
MRKSSSSTTLNLAVCAITLATLVIAIPAFGQKTQVLLNFKTSSSPGGSGPQGNLVIDHAGNLYGTTFYGGIGSGDDCSDGGTYGCGTAFELTKKKSGAWSETVLRNFGDIGDGAGPAAGLISDSVGNLYGTTVGGGAYGCGTVFELLPASGRAAWTENILHSFCSPGSFVDGSYPYGGLVFDSSGNLYGTAAEGGTGACSCGIAFELSRQTGGTWSETVLHDFGNSGDGANPIAGLVFDGHGNLYGTTGNGGSTCYYGFGCGVVFELSPESGGAWIETILYIFDFGTQDSYGNPESTMTFDPAGNLYGTTLYSPGVFELKPNSEGTWTEETIPVSCCYTNALTVDSKGNLYATNLANTGGSCCGSAFELIPQSNGTWKEKILHNFGTGKQGAYPESPLTFDSAGHLYGTTTQGGASWQVNSGEYSGVVFEITP